jgi:hypothetical protein
MVSIRDLVQLCLIGKYVPQTRMTNTFDCHGEHTLHQGDVIRRGIVQPVLLSLLHQGTNHTRNQSPSKLHTQLAWIGWGIRVCNLEEELECIRGMGGKE